MGLLEKLSSSKHKGILFYINRNKKQGVSRPKKSGQEEVEILRKIKIAHRIAAAKGKK